MRNTALMREIAEASIEALEPMGRVKARYLWRAQALFIAGKVADGCLVTARQFIWLVDHMLEHCPERLSPAARSSMIAARPGIARLAEQDERARHDMRERVRTTLLDDWRRREREIKAARRGRPVQQALPL